MPRTGKLSDLIDNYPVQSPLSLYAGFEVLDEADGTGSSGTGTAGDRNNFGVYRKDVLGIPNSVVFSSSTNANLGTVVTSASKEITGDFYMVWPLCVRGDGTPQLCVNNNGEWSASANARHGDTVQVRLTSSGSLSTARTCVLYLPGRIAPFTVTTTSYTLSSSGTIAFLLDPSDAANVTLSGSDITALQDTSGNNRDPALSSTKPTYVTGGSGINGLSVIRTAAGSSYFEMPSSVLTATGSSFTIVGVVRTNQTGGFVAIFDGAGRELSLFYSSTTGQLSYYGLGGSAASPGGSQPLPNSAVGIVSIRFTSVGASGAIIIGNGDLTGATVTTSSIDAEAVRFGDNPSGGGTDSNADYGEWVVFDADIGDTELRKVEGYLAHKWGCASVLPAMHPYKSVAP